MYKTSLGFCFRGFCFRGFCFRRVFDVLNLLLCQRVLTVKYGHRMQNSSKGAFEITAAK